MSSPVPPALTTAQRSEGIRAAAHAVGFATAKLARLGPAGSQPNADAFNQWLAAGHNGPLEYLARRSELRANLRAWYPWIRSLLLCAAYYDGSERGTAGTDAVAHVARYARGRDYHAIFKKRLRLLERMLATSGLCARARNFVDTSPVLERAWAELAGVGWIGKNACLIDPVRGSYMVLGGLVLDAEIEPDAPAQPHCGTCTRCLEACPTGALTAPGVLDARFCLTTYSIETHGQMPREFWPLAGPWALGCDICQQVCPYNAPRRLPEPDPELARPLPWQHAPLEALIALDTAAFGRLFPASTLRRTGREGIRLGAITAAGNTRSERCRAALLACADDPSPAIRERAAWALERLADAPENNTGAGSSPSSRASLPR